MKPTIAAAVLASLLMPVCSSPGAAETKPGTGDALIKGAPLDAVLIRIKHEVGLFLSDTAIVHKKWPELLTDLKVTPACGTAKIDFQLTKVKMAFSAGIDRSIDGGIGLKIPYGDIKADAGGSASNNNRQELVYNYYPPTGAPVEDHEFDDQRPTAIIVATLDAMRDALIKATAQKPCFRSTAATDEDDSFAFSVEIKEDLKASVGFSIAVVDAHAGADRAVTSGNTITVSFRPKSF